MQIPFDRPLMGPTRFEETNVPPVLVQLPQNMAYLIPRATALLLTRANEAATMSPGRCACFNALVINNFQNQFLSEWVNITIRIAFDKASKAGNPNTLDAYLADAAGEALGYLTSMLIVRTPEIYARSNPQAQGAASHNVSQFQNYRDTLFNLNFTTLSNPVASNYGHSYATANQQPQQYGQPVQNTTWGAAPTGQQQGYGQPAAPAQPSSTWAQAPAANAQPPAYQPQVSATKQAAWFNSEQATYGNAVQVETKSEINTTKEFLQATEDVPAIAASVYQPTSLNPTLVQKGHEMDINNHAIPYFGSTQLLDMSNRRMDLKAEVLQITREGRRPENSVGPLLLENNLGVEISVDSAVFMTRGALNAANNNPPVRIFRQFHNVLNPTICTEVTCKLMNVLKSDTTIYDLPIKFQHLVKTMADPSNPTEEDQQALNFLAYLDRKLAMAINGFLRYNLRVSGVRMKTFSDSILQLREHLQNNKGERYATALDVWASRLLSMLRDNYNQVAEDFLSGFFGQTGESELVTHVGYFPTVISVTLLELTEKELAYDATFEGTEIDPKMTHVLHDLATGLHRNKKDLGVFTTLDLVVAADDTRYIIAEDALEPGRFLLYRVE